MKNWLKKNSTFLKKLIFSLVLVNFLLISWVTPVAAQSTSNPTTTQTTQTPAQAQAQTPQTTSTTNPSGQVLGISFKGIGRCVTNPVSCAKEGLSDAAAASIDFIFENLFELVEKVIVYVLHIVAAALGSDTSQACAGSSGGDAECLQAAAYLAQYDPLFEQTASPTASLNLFTILDSSYSNLYASIPQTNPIEEVTYIARNNLLGIGEVQAQGRGTESMGDFIRAIWSKMRDLSYVMTVVVLVVIGFMVMLRKRLDPRTVVTATSALPKVALALVLITFSFAISGLMIDFIFVSVSIVRDYFKDLPGLSGALNYMTTRIGGGEFTWLPFLTLISNSVINWKVFIVAIGAALLTGPVGILALIPIIAALGIDVIIRLGLFVLAIILFWHLLKRFVQMVVLTIFSPFFFLAGAIPGFENATVGWFKRMAAAALTFPVILVIVYLAVALLRPKLPGIELDSLSNCIDGALCPPEPLQSAGYFLNLTPLAGLGILYFATQVPGMLDDLLGAKGPKDKGVSPFILLGGLMAGAQTIGTVGKASPVIHGLTKDIAGYPGMRGRVGGWVQRGLGVLGERNALSREQLAERATMTRPARGVPAREATLHTSRTESGGVTDTTATTEAHGPIAGPTVPGHIVRDSGLEVPPERTAAPRTGPRTVDPDEDPGPPDLFNRRNRR